MNCTNIEINIDNNTTTDFTVVGIDNKLIINIITIHHHNNLSYTKLHTIMYHASVDNISAIIINLTCVLNE